MVPKKKLPASAPETIVLDGTQTGLACALYQGLLDDADRDRIVANLVDKVNRSGGHIDTVSPAR